MKGCGSRSTFLPETGSFQKPKEISVPTILVVDDDRNLLKIICDILEGLAVDLVTASNAESALSAIKSQAFDLVITDLKMPGKSGMDVLAFSLKMNASVPVIMLSAFGSIEAAVDAMKKGAYDFITKPFNADELLQIVRKALSVSCKDKELLSPYFDDVKSFAPDIVGRTLAITQILHMIKRVAPADSSVLISGETGVGKELVARAVHLASPRRARPFIKVNCAAIPDALLESDLFGYEKGAFTGAVVTKPGRFELANSGTIFLDEIGELPLNLQAKLLAVIQDRAFERVGGVKTIRVDIRIVAATNKDLAAACHVGAFRSDLFYRLNVVPLCIPPLRERREDIVPLAEYFINRLATRYKRSVGIPPEILNAFIAYDWPGNIRELENVIERMFVLSEGDILDTALLPVEMNSQNVPDPNSSYKSRTESVTRNTEKQMIVNALNSTDQNRTRAATLLGVSRRTLQNKIKEFGL
jgi:two-component system, NtrC family, response regulator AtoC